MIEIAIKNVTEGQDLSAAEASTVVEEIMTGKAQDIQIAVLLTALSSKGETAAEIAGAARAMRAAAVAFPSQPQALDIVGTGGDHSNSFNISSTAAIVIASLGYDVVKHGNRAASSKSGAADVLEALGFPINQSVAESEAMLAKHHFTFLFAQQYHQAMKYVAPVRKALGIRTIFNLLGPIANPAGPKKVVLGVYDASLLEPMAQVLHQLGVESANVIYGTDGMDEASIAAPTKVVQLRGDQITYQTIRPADFGLEEAAKAEIIGGTAAENAAITRSVLAGKAGAPRDIVVLNAALGLNVLDEQISLQEGARLAQEAIDSGKAEALLDNLVAGVELAL